MRRTRLVLAIAAVMAVMMVAASAPAMAKGSSGVSIGGLHNGGGVTLVSGLSNFGNSGSDVSFGSFGSNFGSFESGGLDIDNDVFSNDLEQGGNGLFIG
jgi:hypothetical protein